jgi:hypothetical protein
MGKIESQIGGFQSGGEFFVSENITATPDPLLSLTLLRDEQRLSLEKFIDGSYHPS